MKWLAFDIGGANLKMADGDALAKSESFPLWKQPHRLADTLRWMMADAPAFDQLAITMTGELADCFASKEEGVRFILEAVGQSAEGRPTSVYLTDGRLVKTQVALETPLLAAASNWRALAQFVGRYAPEGSALLIDIGSTTCDLVPLREAQPAATGATDTARLIEGELIYTGVQRSPVCALIETAMYRGKPCSIAEEFFATSGDAYLMLGDLPENADEVQTADGRPATVGAAQLRLGRMICADHRNFDRNDALSLAHTIAQVQQDKIAKGIRRIAEAMSSPPQAFILSGQGEFLARRALETLQRLPRRIISLTDELGTDVARCATAHALANLAAEEGPE